MIDINKAIGRRANFISLDGEWLFDYDDENIGIKEKWHLRHEYPKRINVPYVYSSVKSGIDDKSYHPVLWYSKEIKSSFANDTYLIFSSVDYYATLYVNGIFVSNNKGGYLPFEVNITPYLNDKGETNTIVLRVEDYKNDYQLRGKQSWEEKPTRCWYTQSSGIWQSVYLEERQDVFIDRILVTPFVDSQAVEIAILFNKEFKGKCRALVRDESEREIERVSFSVDGIEKRIRITLPLGDSVDELNYWSPDNPVLFYLTLTLSNGDEKSTSFGLRNIRVEDGKVLLNNKPFFSRMILNQGYFDDSLLTGTVEEYESDLVLIKKMGFNGVRMHQKIESPYFYYLADKIGVVVWAECPSGYNYSSFERKELLSTIYNYVELYYNHPSIVAWVPLNESWGVRKIVNDKPTQDFANSIYYLIKSLDPTRLVSTNDGWEQCISDLSSLHDYAKNGSVMEEEWKNGFPTALPSRKTYAVGYKYNGEPVFISEFGGIAFSNTESESWGYEGKEATMESFLLRLKSLVDAIYKIPNISGFCYTQFADTFQEANGLLYSNRKEKIPIEEIKKIIKR